MPGPPTGGELEHKLGEKEQAFKAFPVKISDEVAQELA